MSSRASNRKHPSEQDKNGKAKNWFLTLNNWTQEDINNIKTRFEDKSKEVEYVVCKAEICPTTGTKHLQGGICFLKRKRWNQARAYFDRSDGSNNSFLYVMRGTPDETDKYASKEATTDPDFPEVIRLGSKPAGQGARTDIGAITDAIRGGATELDIFEADPEFYIKHPTGVRRAIQISKAKRTFKSKVYWFYGESGSGKSQKAYEIGGIDAYYKNASMEHWENYQNEDFVVIDDYRPSMCPFSEFLRILDRYPHLVNVKCNFAQFTTKWIIITSPRSPRETWKNQKEEDLYQLERRITQIVKFERGKAPWSEDKQQEFVFDPDEEHVDREAPANTEPTQYADIFNPHKKQKTQNVIEL